MHYAPASAYEATLAAVFGKKAPKRRVWLLYPPTMAN
jgi:hypothetical protein